MERLSTSEERDRTDLGEQSQRIRNAGLDDKPSGLETDDPPEQGQEGREAVAGSDGAVVDADAPPAPPEPGKLTPAELAKPPEDYLDPTGEQLETSPTAVDPLDQQATNVDPQAVADMGAAAQPEAGTAADQPDPDDDEHSDA